ncbi:hypothetical protein A4R44_07477 [Amycolatopsis sp. M39]|nr:hypothetical protein A4R44_07477 [Amycolatopsis sp. M39]
MARALLGERFDSGSFTYALMCAFAVGYLAAREVSRWHEIAAGSGPSSAATGPVGTLTR